MCSNAYYSATGYLPCNACPTGSTNVGVGNKDCTICKANYQMTSSGCIYCSYGAASTPECLSGYTYKSTGCYKLITAALKWDDAVTSCNKNYNGWLITVSSQAENDIAYSMVTNKNLWIGLGDAQKEGTLMLVNDEGQAIYKNWNSGEPNNGIGNYEEDCVAMLYGISGKWNDESCGTAYGYICETNIQYKNTICKNSLYNMINPVLRRK